MTNHFHDKNVVAPSDFFCCFSKKADCLSLIASLCIAIYLLPILFGLLLKVKCNHMQLFRSIHMPVNTTSPSLYITSSYAVKFLLCAVLCRRNSSPLHWQMKELIVVIFPLHLVLAKCLSLAHRLFYLKTSVNDFPRVKLIFKIVNNKVNIITINLRLASIAILLIVVSNPSILNPGPAKFNGIKCYFQSVQGLVTFSSVGKPFPDLNQTKISELQTHIFENSPDVVIFNETWLKPTIKSSEILSTDIYKIFRLDRTAESHPPDPENPYKFKCNGGGVLIGIKKSLNLNPKLLKQTCKAEVLSIELSLPNKKKRYVYLQCTE